MGPNGPPDLAALFLPGHIGRMELRNRLVQAPLFTFFATPGGEASERIVEYYRERARGGVGLIISENAAIDWDLGKVGNPLRVDHDRFGAGLARVAEAVHNEGGRIALQLYHAGRQTSYASIRAGAQPIAPTGGLTNPGSSPPRAITHDEISVLVESYAAAARRALQAGFDAVELHGAHGYLLAQFLSPKTNQRQDEYGGWLEHRARFNLEVVSAVRRAVGPEFPIIYRMSVEEPYEGGLSLQDGVAFAKMLASHVDAVSVSAGNQETGTIITSLGQPGNLLPYALAVREQVEVPVIGVGRLDRRLIEAAAAVGDNRLDFVAIGRGQLAEPAFANKLRSAAAIRPCIACNECLSAYIGNWKGVQCVVNPELGQEARAAAHRAAGGVRGKVLVVGAGPAGLEAARTARLRGYDVTIMDKSDRVGGLLLGWSAASIRRREILDLLAYYSEELQKHAVRVALDKPFQPEMIHRYDKVLMATGTRPADEMSGIDAVAMLARASVPKARKLIVFGRSEIAFYACLWLVENGKEVELHSPVTEAGIEANPAMRTYLSSQLRAHGVPIKTEAGRPADDVLVWAEPRIASSDWGDLIDNNRVFSVGSRLRGGRLYEATQSGYWTGATV